MQMATVPKQELTLRLGFILVLLGSISYCALLSVGPVLLFYYAAVGRTQVTAAV